jgi:hypothetical protein
MAYGNAHGWVPVRKSSAPTTTRQWLVSNSPRIAMAVWLGLILAAKAAGALG